MEDNKTIFDTKNQMDVSGTFEKKIDAKQIAIIETQFQCSKCITENWFQCICEDMYFIKVIQSITKESKMSP